MTLLYHLSMVWRRLFARRRGDTAITYVLLASMLALGIVASIFAMGGDLNEWYQRIDLQITSE